MIHGTRIKYTLSAGLLLSLSALATGASAASWGLGGFSGQSQAFSQGSCFSEDWGSVKSSCTSNPGWEVSPPVQSPGSYWTPVLHVYASSNSTIKCGVNGVTNDRLSIWTTPQQSDSNGPAALSFNVWVPNSGYLFAACYMGSGTEWYSINY